jgi:hypothetical protein
MVVDLQRNIANYLQNAYIAPLSFRKIEIRRHGAVVVSMLTAGPKGCGFKTRPRRWIFKVDKNPQHTFLSDGK